MKNYYDVLGVNEQSTSADITKAFKDLAKQHHPDRGGNKDKFQEINEAHDTLKNSQKRHDYDTMRKFGSANTGGGQHPFFNEDIFGDFFSGFQGGDMDFNSVSTSQRTWRRKDIQTEQSNREATGMFR